MQDLTAGRGLEKPDSELLSAATTNPPPVVVCQAAFLFFTAPEIHPSGPENAKKTSPEIGYLPL